MAKRQVTSLAEWGPWQALGEPVQDNAGRKGGGGGAGSSSSGGDSMAGLVTDVIDTPLPGAVVREQNACFFFFFFFFFKPSSFFFLAGEEAGEGPQDSGLYSDWRCGRLALPASNRGNNRETIVLF